MASGRRRWASRPVLIALLVGAVVATGAVVARVVSHSDKKSAPVTSGSPSSSPAFPTFRSKMGLTTGVQLWNLPPAQMDSEIAGIAATGATWLRSALRWDSVEPVSANHDDWSRSDRIVTDTRRGGVSVIFNVEGAPDWAGGQLTGEFSTDPQLYARFVAKVAARYRGRVRVYELGNEPNLTAYVRHPDAATYAKILKAAYPAIKAVDPSAFVLTAGLAGGRDRNGNITADTYLRELYRNGAKGFFDALAFHPYTYPQLPTQEASAGGRNWSKMLSVRSIMVQNGDASRPIWITEFGAPTNGPGGVSQQQQAAIMQNGFQLWKTYAWGGVMCWFDYRDKGTDTSTHKDFFGIITNSGARKASYATYAALARG